MQKTAVRPPYRLCSLTWGNLQSRPFRTSKQDKKNLPKENNLGPATRLLPHALVKLGSWKRRHGVTGMIDMPNGQYHHPFPIWACCTSEGGLRTFFIFFYLSRTCTSLHPLHNTYSFFPSAFSALFGLFWISRYLSNLAFLRQVLERSEIQRGETPYQAYPAVLFIIPGF